jgi:hypothetical protein
MLLPAPSSWDYLAYLLTSCELLDLTPAPRRTAAAACWELVEGCLGPSLALTFGAYLRELRLPEFPDSSPQQLPAPEALDDAVLYVFSQQMASRIAAGRESEVGTAWAKAYLQYLSVAHASGREEWLEDSMSRLHSLGLLPTLLNQPTVVPGFGREEVLALFTKFKST